MADESYLDLCSDTLNLNKQALVFVSTKSSAEKAAEEIAKKYKRETKDQLALAEKVGNILATKTKQCKRLEKTLKKGIAFHHAGLTQQQRTLIEDGFRDGVVRIICCTPTLCLAGDTEIWTEEGQTKISQLKASQEIFALTDHSLRLMKPQKVEQLEPGKQLIEISSVANYSIRVTPDHKMFIKRKNKKVLVLAKDVKRGDRIATVGKLSIKQHLIPKVKHFVKKNQIPKNKTITKEIAYFIGAMLGDGYSGACSTKTGIKYKSNPSIVGIDEEIFFQIEQVCKEFNLNLRKSRTSHGIPQLIMGKNNWFREFLVNCGVEQRENKHINQLLMRMKDEQIAALLRGVFDTDGYVQKRTGVGFSNCSRMLVKQVQRLLLRFGIVCAIRKKKAGTMKIYDKEYKTKPQFELLITQKTSVVEFYKCIGFSIKRKEEALLDVVARIFANIHYVSCKKCCYKVYRDLFSGRTHEQKQWGLQKKKIIMLLGKKGEKGSREIKKQLGIDPRKNEARLNHHYELIKKKRKGNRGSSEWYWSLNEIGKWVYSNLLVKEKSLTEFFKNTQCPLCKNEFDWTVKKGWRDKDKEGDIFWDIVKSVKSQPAQGPVFDVVLGSRPENDHLFVANGFIVHNSYGVDTPAFRAIIRDVKRYTQRGMTNIPVLDYLQMAGRAGRPQLDSHGEAILVAKNEDDADELTAEYIYGKPEPIYSKLAVEPVLRTAALSLIATGHCRTEKTLKEFFARTFWAHQFQDMRKLAAILDRVIQSLEEWRLVTTGKPKPSDGFSSGEDFVETNNTLRATPLGIRVSQLYIDPYTAHQFLQALDNVGKKTNIPYFSWLLTLTQALEMRPQLRVGKRDFDEVTETLLSFEGKLLTKEPSLYDPDFDDYLDAAKTAMLLAEWCEEADEEYLLEKFNARPGELRGKLNVADWLVYALNELAYVAGYRDMQAAIRRVRTRLKYGVKEELLPLLRLRGVGRNRSRKLFNAGIKTLQDVQNCDPTSLAQLVGSKNAVSLKKQVGKDIPEPLNPGKRKGQMGLLKYV